MIRKFISIALVLCLLLSLAACGTGDPGTSAATTAPITTGASSITILTEQESYTVEMNKMVEIKASVEGGDGSVTLSYESGDTAIATVNKYGKIIGVRAGTTEVTITASDGTVKVVPVTVEGPKYENVLRVALNVLYNDSALGCFNTEYGPYVEIYEDGQYTVSFNTTMHLSESSQRMGVTGLDNLTSIFLYDQAVRNGDQMYSSVVACNIRWDKIEVNGQQLTITNGEFKSALKASGIFDTNDPFNSWEGSCVEEVTVDTENHVLNINVDDPYTITITFTIEGLEFAE